jgi:Mycothiol maleylpyruvate isomerase N-terminal domain
VSPPLCSRQEAGRRQDRLATLRLLWAARQGRALSAEQWDRPTRLGDWTVRMLYAHAAGWPVGLSRLVGMVREAEPTHATAAALLRDFNRPGGIASSEAGDVAARAREAASAGTPAELIERFRRAAAERPAEPRVREPRSADGRGGGRKDAPSARASQLGVSILLAGWEPVEGIGAPSCSSTALNAPLGGCCG